ncbi:MAG: hypothetical protein LQ348_006064, partial [Seirophora lacunosa]
MSIAALSAQAVQAIGSTQVLTDSASLVKELIDNALDAQATSITVEISTNALDIIQVKDNGHGIAPIDRPMLCKRHCTSKIKDLQDLARIGGASLGFRGEALASAGEMSGSLLLITRILGEITAVSLKVSQTGENEMYHAWTALRPHSLLTVGYSGDPVSQAVGTTVRVTDFFKSLPVRRQTALKDSNKQLTKIKRILQAYAFARPSVRLNLKVLKAKNNKGSWLYAPKAKANVSDAAIKIIGTRAADQCHWILWSSENPSIPTAATDTDSQVETNSSYTVEALMPKVDSDSSAISNIGQYIAVDSRPVSCTRGTLKQITQLFKSYLRSSISTTVDQKITDPFLCMNLICPPGSYDANVEPAKDDVLFTNSSRVLALVECFFKDQYGVLQFKERDSTKVKLPATEPRSFDLLLARKPPTAATQPLAPPTQPSSFPSSVTSQPLETPMAGSEGPVGTKVDEQSQVGEHDARRSSPHSPVDAEERSFEISRPLPAPAYPSGEDNQRWRHSMYLDADDEELLDADPTTPNDDIGEEDLGAITVTNPWTLAKLNAPIRNRNQAGQSSDEVANNPQLMTPARGHDELHRALSPPVRFPRPDLNHSLLSPAKSQSSIVTDPSSPERFPYPIKAWGKAQRGSAASPHEASSESHSSSSSLRDTWIQRPPTQHNEASLLSELDQDLSRPRSVPLAVLPQGTPLSAIPDISHKPNRKGGPHKQQQQQQQRQSNVNKPFTPPVQEPSHVWFDHLEPPSARPPKSTLRRRLQETHAGDAPIHAFTGPANDPIETSPPPPTTIPQHPGLALTMDYERRKAEAVAAHRALRRQQAAQFPKPTTASSLLPHATTSFPDSSPAVAPSPQ